MARYWILEPCVFVKDGAVVHYQRPPHYAVELDEAVAAELGDKVRRAGERPSGVTQGPPPAVEGLRVRSEPAKVKRRNKRRAEGEPKSDPAPAVVNEPTPKKEGFFSYGFNAPADRAGTEQEASD